MEELVLVKLGGGVITDKARLETPDLDAITRLAKEVHEAHVTGDLKLIIGHGGGSYPHRPASEYCVHKGVTGKMSCKGISLVQDAASRLNRIVVSELLEADENAISFQPSACMMTDAGLVSEGFIEPMRTALSLDLVPVPYGDVVFDTKIKCSILSTERLLNYLAAQFSARRVVIATKEDGVWEDFPARKTLIEEITPASFNEIRMHLRGSGDVDVTGGMFHKVEKMVELAEKTGAETIIINGNEPERLRDALLGRKVVGTRVRP